MARTNKSTEMTAGLDNISTKKVWWQLEDDDFQFPFPSEQAYIRIATLYNSVHQKQVTKSNKLCKRPSSAGLKIYLKLFPRNKPETLPNICGVFCKIG